MSVRDKLPTAAIYEMRRKLRALYDSDPQAFEECMRSIVSRGDAWRAALPPMETARGKPIQVSDASLAMLLADYRNRPSGVSRDEFLDALARKGCAYGNPYFVGEWRNAETIRTHLKNAEKKAREDSSFADEVNFNQWALSVISV
ncbi:MAG: hypothetical protein RBU21_10200 [FCB group bacterium]|jgi:hypothetical protein|nr:hypothetical protein [FCB group bacterium]